MRFFRLAEFNFVCLATIVVATCAVPYVIGYQGPIEEEVTPVEPENGCSDKCVYSSCITIDVLTSRNGTKQPVCMELRGGPRAFFLHTKAAGSPDMDGTDPVMIRRSPCSSECSPVATEGEGIEMAQGSCGGGNGNWQDGRCAEECRDASGRPVPYPEEETQGGAL